MFRRKRNDDLFVLMAACEGVQACLDTPRPEGAERFRVEFQRDALIDVPGFGIKLIWLNSLGVPV